MYIQSFKQLIVWQKAMEPVKRVYEATTQLPKYELFGLSSQMRRSAISIPSNIAEGRKRKNKKEFIQFLSIADASATEPETQILISLDLYPNINFSNAEPLLREAQKMLITIIKKLKAGS